MTPLKGARVVVIGASAGIGRAFATAAVDAGAQVVAAARRADALAELDGAHGVAADVCTDDGRAAIVDACRRRLGGLDLVLHAAGRADLSLVADTGDDTWRATLETNVVAFNRLVAAALPLLDPPAVVAALSSETSVVPRSGLVAYAASKAALETSVKGWQVEHPGLRFSVVTVGATQPTEFGHGFGGDLLGPALRDWNRRGLMQAAYMDTGEVADLLVTLYGAAIANPSVGVEHVVLRSPSDLA
jgi:NAD(P)-dependent dehydrogenase (short-subunit alcohol dehydrogenase family)